MKNCLLTLVCGLFFAAQSAAQVHLPAETDSSIYGPLPTVCARADYMVINSLPFPVMVVSSRFAVKTNVALLATGVANIGFEVALGRHTSVDVPFIYSPYTLKRDYRIQVLALQPEFRYWLKEPLNGHFFGIHAALGWFNVAMDGKKRYQDNRPLWEIGLSYGYVLAFNNHWGAEFTIGAGYADIGYDTYYNIKNGAQFDSSSKHYWGITRLGVTLVYKFNLR